MGGLDARLAAPGACILLLVCGAAYNLGASTTEEQAAMMVRDYSGLLQSAKRQLGSCTAALEKKGDAATVIQHLEETIVLEEANVARYNNLLTQHEKERELCTSQLQRDWGLRDRAAKNADHPATRLRSLEEEQANLEILIKEASADKDQMKALLKMKFRALRLENRRLREKRMGMGSTTPASIDDKDKDLLAAHEAARKRAGIGEKDAGGGTDVSGIDQEIQDVLRQLEEAVKRDGAAGAPQPAV